MVSTPKDERRELEEEARVVFDSIRRIVRALGQSARYADGDARVGVAQLFVLQKLDDATGPMTLNDLADATLTHQSTVSVVVSKLVRRKLVVRARSSADARAIALTISPEGRALLRSGPLPVQERLRQAIVSMDAETRRELVGGLQELLRKAGLDSEEAALFFEDQGESNERQTR